MELYNFIAYIAVIILFISLVGVKLEAVSVSAPMIALLAGIITGPYFLNLFNVEIDLATLKIIAEITVAIAVMSGALKVPKDYFKNNLKPIVILFFLVIPGMWLLSTAGFYWLIPGISLSMAFLIGAILTPTDPVVSSTIITGRFAEKYFPDKLRNIIAFESGANDGLAYPLVLLSLFLFQRRENIISVWLTQTLFYQNILAIVTGIIIGYAFGKLYHYAHKQKFMSKSAYVIYTLMITFFLLFICKSLKMNSIICVFVAGLLFNMSTDRNEEEHMYEMQETFESLFTIPVFLILGYLLPISGFLKLGLPLLLSIFFLLVFKRIPIIHSLFISKNFRNEKELLLLGWFGPFGIAALFYSLEMKEITGEKLFFEITAFAILASTLIHGFTSLPLSKWYKNSIQQT